MNGEPDAAAQWDLGRLQELQRRQAMGIKEAPTGKDPSDRAVAEYIEPDHEDGGEELETSGGESSGASSAETGDSTTGGDRIENYGKDDGENSLQPI